MDKDSKIVIIGAGIFGLSTAHQLASEGFQNIVVLDRHTPPVPDGSSTDISRVVRFDYADEDYMTIAYEAYQRWRNTPKYKGIFFPADYLIVKSQRPGGTPWIENSLRQITKKGVAATRVDTAKAARRRFPMLSGDLAPDFAGYSHNQAGWADASKAVQQVSNECLALGVSMLCGKAGTVIGFESSNGKIKAARTSTGDLVHGDRFILTAGSWTAGLVNMYNSVLSTAQVLGYTRLSDDEMRKYENIPIYTNISTGWFNFPPHKDGNYLKMAVHGWGYTRKPTETESRSRASSSPPLSHRLQRANYTPADGEQRLRHGLREIVPELAERPFEKTAVCWYTDTPTGDFIMSYHPDFSNLFIGGGGSGHAFKFLPVLGEYMAKAIQGKLPANLAKKWRFRTEYQNDPNTFVGDGSRGGPLRRELSQSEKASLEVRSKL